MKVEQLQALRALDARVLAVGHRLAVRNADLCESTVPQPGAALHMLSQYSAAYRPSAAAAFGLGEQPAILAVVPDGPAAMAGVRPDDAVIAADGAALGVPADRRRRGRHEPVERATDLLDAAFADGAAMLEIERGGEPLQLQVRAVPVCRGRFQLVPGDRLSASADGRYIQLSAAMAEYARSDDELAAVLAHELAHHVLEHRRRLREAGVARGAFEALSGGAGAIRRSEEEADRLSVYLLDRAGYDPAAAVSFWQRFGPERSLGIFNSPTHPGWKDRIALIGEEITRLAELKAATPNPRPPLLSGPLPSLR